MFSTGAGGRGTSPLPWRESQRSVWHEDLPGYLWWGQVCLEDSARHEGEGSLFRIYQGLHRCKEARFWCLHWPTEEVRRCHSTGMLLRQTRLSFMSKNELLTATAESKCQHLSSERLTNLPVDWLLWALSWKKHSLQKDVTVAPCLSHQPI